MSSPIHDVSDTAFWIAYHRALESERPDALFHDPFAKRLAGERGRRISESMPTSRIVAWTVALRTRIIDDYIVAALHAGIDTVLCLGAGLDARPYRMPLPAEVRWIEAAIWSATLTVFCVGLFVYGLNLPLQLWPR